MRESNNDIEPITVRILNGFDYRAQAWVKDGRYLDCAHVPKHLTCFGARHKGEETKGDGVCPACGHALENDLSGTWCSHCGGNK